MIAKVWRQRKQKWVKHTQVNCVAVRQLCKGKSKPMGRGQDLINNLVTNISELETHRPEWHTTMVETGYHLRTTVFGLMGTIHKTKHDPKLHVYNTETMVALVDLFPILTNMKNSWSNNFKAKMVWKHKNDVAAEVASQLMDGVLVLHGVAAEEAYANIFDLIRPCVSHRWLSKEDTEVLRKIFGWFNGTGIKVEQLEAKFLAKNLEYAQGTKRKRDAKVAASKVIVEGLTANMVEGYIANKELQEKVHGRFVKFINAVEEDFNEAGLGELDGYQVDSVLGAAWCISILQRGNFEKVPTEKDTAEGLVL